MEDELFLGDPPGAQLPPWKEFRVGLNGLLDVLVPKKLWWHSTPGWWYDDSGVGRMRDFITKRMVMVEMLGQRSASLLLSLLDLLKFGVPRALARAVG
jgi:hypothetical protein